MSNPNQMNHQQQQLRCSSQFNPMQLNIPLPRPVNMYPISPIYPVPLTQINHQFTSQSQQQAIDYENNPFNRIPESFPTKKTLDTNQVSNNAVSLSQFNSKTPTIRQIYQENKVKYFKKFQLYLILSFNFILSHLHLNLQIH